MSRHPVGEAEHTSLAWEQEKGVLNDYMGIARIAVDTDIELLNRFADDELEDVVRWITQIDADMIEDDLKDDVRGKSLRYWIEGRVLKKRVDKVGCVTAIPIKEGLDLVVEQHQASGHLGRDLMLSRLAKSYSWSTMRKDIDEGLKACQRCAQFGNRLAKLLIRPVMRFNPFDLVAMDFLHMPKGTGNMSLVLVAIDCFTRYIMVWAFKGAPTSKMVLKGLQEISDRFVVPKSLYLDNGSAFKSREVDRWTTENKVKVEYSTPYAHVGMVENANHQVLERLRRIANLDIAHIPGLTDPEYPRRWPDQLQAAIARCNERNLPYLGGYSPKELLFGGLPSARDQNDIEPERRLLLLDVARSEAISSFHKEQHHRRKKGGSWNVYEPRIGDLVLSYDASSLRTFDTRYKLKARWTGPFRVVHSARRSASLETLDGQPRGKVPWNMIKRWMKRRAEEGEDERENDLGDEDGDEAGDGRENGSDDEGGEEDGD
ncbi:hypothetical protein FFLO_07074 [Filobasidium floriforme]|uniref:Integrase catalytic domain-containing protein n=1 Tax=Filobasidium floriforme TaxID=5210 RepID=A0A8K0JDL9_9TREE|nr:hypothetical protein FFLO_07074 [Filobasidium floriforme]